MAEVLRRFREHLRRRSARRTTTDRTAAQRRLDQRRVYPCAGGLRRRAFNSAILREWAVVLEWGAGVE